MLESYRDWSLVQTEVLFYKMYLQWNPDSTNLQGKRELVRKIGGKITVFD